MAGNWLGDSEHGRRSIAASGDDDVAPRAYQTGDALRRVHWRSTARYGELMVRREEQHWRNTASLFLDTRRGAYAGPLFELAVIAAASIGVHMAGEGYDAHFVTDAGEVPRQGPFQDTLLDTLAVIRPSRDGGLATGIEALPRRAGRSSPCSDCSPPSRPGSCRRAARHGAGGWPCCSCPAKTATAGRGRPRRARRP